jgi:hypothetical protein
MRDKTVFYKAHPSLLLMLPMLCILLLLALSQCKKDCGIHNYGTLLLDTADLAMNPYTGGENLVFSDSAGNSVSCAFKFRETTYSWLWPDPSNFLSDNRGCLENYYNMELNATLFEDVDSSCIMGLSIWTTNPFEAAPPYKMLTIGLSACPGDSVDAKFEGHYCIDFQTIADPPMFLRYNSTVIGFHDSIMLGSATFVSIFELAEHRKKVGPEYISGGISRLYYSIIMGVVGFRTTEGVTYFLEP